MTPFYFCEKIKVPTSKSIAADRNTGKVTYNWQAMSKRLELDKIGVVAFSKHPVMEPQ